MKGNVNFLDLLKERSSDFELELSETYMYTLGKTFFECFKVASLDGPRLAQGVMKKLDDPNE